MRTLQSPATLQGEMVRLRTSGQRIGFVPTMGFLHDGHLSLMRLAREQCDHLVVSIYVNPLQFGPNEDLDRYPRDPEGDAAKCESVGVDTLFLPETLDDDDHSTTVAVAGLTRGLCGTSRPGHFAGSPWWLPPSASCAPRYCLWRRTTRLLSSDAWCATCPLSRWSAVLDPRLNGLARAPETRARCRSTGRALARQALQAIKTTPALPSASRMV